MLLEIIPTDLSSTVVIGSVLSVIVVIISYVVYKIGIGEKSFEEVIEEQKRRSIEEELKQKSEKVKKEKKFKKTWGKKSKEKAEPDMTPEPVTEKKDAIPEIEIFEPKEMKPVKQKNKSKSNVQSESQAPEKVKKVENSPVIDKPSQEKKKSADVEKVKMEQKATETVKPVEVKETVLPPVQSVQTAVTVNKKKKSTENAKLVVETKEIVQTTVVTSVQSANQVSVTAPKKKKKEQVEKDATPMTIDKLLLFIKESELEAEEIQNLIDVLLNKQKDSSGWTKKNDTLALAKKNLIAKEQLLDQEQRQNQVVTSKLKDLREEYNTVKSKYSAQEKANSEKIARQQQEIQALTVKVKQVQDQLAADKEKLTLSEKENEKLQASVKNFEEEKAKLQQKISKLEAESCPRYIKI